MSSAPCITGISYESTAAGETTGMRDATSWTLARPMSARSSAREAQAEARTACSTMAGTLRAARRAVKRRGRAASPSGRGAPEPGGRALAGRVPIRAVPGPGRHGGDRDGHAPGARAGGVVSAAQSTDRWYAAAAWNSTSSRKCGATSIMPTGRPSTLPHGMLIAG
jgi:hypothetical protein